MEKKTNKKLKQRGITLIALVITIIVLLILAGVSIAMLTGDNGILTQANEAKIENEEATDLEIVRLAVTTGKLENITEGTDINTAIQNELRRTDSEATVEGKGDDKDITYNDKLYKINIKIGSEEIEKPFEKPNYNEEMKKLKQGDYVVYDTGIEGVGEVICRVLYDTSSEYGLQIITDDCLKKDGEYINLRYGPEYGSVMPDWDEEYINAKKEYNQLIKILNEESMKYLNSNLVIDARCVGSNPKQKNSETKETKIYKDETGYEVEIIDSEIKDEDTNYEFDYETLEKFNLLNTNKSYWLASRYNEEGNVYFGRGIHFYLRTVGEEEKKPTVALAYKDAIYNQTNPVTNGLRPVFFLKGELKIINGAGTEELPYELGV